PGEGRVFVFPGSPSGLAASPSWSAAGGQAFARFGAAVSSGGGDVIIGAPMYDNGQSNEGRVFFFAGSPTGLAALPSWTAESDQADAHMGVSVALGDLNGDGFAEAIAGADLYDNGVADRGRVSVFAGSSTGPANQPLWIGEGDQAGARFGFSLAVAAGFSGDNYGDLVIGAPGYDNGQVDEGRAYVYLGSPFGPGSIPARTMESDQTGAQLGISVASAGDINGDGRTDLILGASLYDTGQSNAGRAQVWLGSAGLQPLPGAAFFYYVRPGNACGSGPLGFSSDGTARTGAACP
ncbi:MAG TPA: hypothetical protein VFE84_03880, partial [Patescibacteria group bacterium]|nr:hypothetical protein [Patescibacteria group bacterium]